MKPHRELESYFSFDNFVERVISIRHSAMDRRRQAERKHQISQTSKKPSADSAVDALLPSRSRLHSCARKAAPGARKATPKARATSPVKVEIPRPRWPAIGTCVAKLSRILPATLAVWKWRKEDCDRGAKSADKMYITPTSFPGGTAHERESQLPVALQRP